MNNRDQIRLAILGCGAVTELAHLPAISRLWNATVSLLVDINVERRNQLATKFAVKHTAGDIDGLYDLFDAAIVALPHALHASVSAKLLGQGKSVLVEKPMAVTVDDCDAMINAADRAGVVLAVGLFRRFMGPQQFARTLVQQGILGRIESFDFREGSIYDWPVASDFFFRKEAAGGGVLIDTGAHTLDCVLDVLGGFSEVEYFDDAEGGVEANCLIKLRLRDGVPGSIELSRTRELRNTGIIRGSKGVLEITCSRNHLKLSLPNHAYALAGPVCQRSGADEASDHLVCFKAQIEDFLNAIRGHQQSAADGRSARASVELIETCYRNRKPMALPWLDRDMEVTC
jgi:predicted dehydrogenase